MIFLLLNVKNKVNKLILFFFKNIIYIALDQIFSKISVFTNLRAQLRYFKM